MATLALFLRLGKGGSMRIHRPSGLTRLPIHWRWLVALTLIFGLALTSAPPASAAICNSPHCYAINTWNGGTDGALVQIGLTGMTPGPNVGNFINREMWAIDNASEDCAVEICWVEGGSKTFRTDTGTRNVLFWSEKAPGEDFVRNIVTDYYTTDHSLMLFIQQQNYGWSIIGHVDSVSFELPSYNAMVHIERVDVGMEVYGDGGSADVSIWTLNNWNNAGTWMLQASDGTSHVDNPPAEGGWYGGASPSTTNVGGAWYAQCDSPCTP